MQSENALITDEAIRSVFQNAADFDTRRLLCNGYTVYSYSIDGLVSGTAESDFVIKPVCALQGDTLQDLYDAALAGGVCNSVAVPCKDLQDVSLKLVNGFCVILFPGVGAIAFEVKTGEKRGLSAPEVENTVKGPKDAFVETARTNTSLIRRHLRTPKLRIFETQVGSESLTNVSLIWVEGITETALVKRMQRRLQTLCVGSLLSPAAVEEFVTGSRATAFPLLQYTERTDRFCQGLLDGKIGLLVDGLPLAYLAPADLGSLMDSAEDRSRDYVSASCLRVLRYFALVISLLLPGFYIAMASFHQEMIPLPLLRSMIESKQFVPFTTTIEVLSLLIAFELLQESGIHLPQAIGQSVSTIGGIVVGTAAVEASLISPAALIAVSIAGISGFVLPNRDLAEAVRVWRFLIAVLSAVAGLFGTAVGLCLLLTHLSGLTCLGMDYLMPFSGVKDISLFRYRLQMEKKGEKQ